jgi:nucleoside-diphosphate-sugar epimerase
MRIAVTGAAGSLGRALRAHVQLHHELIALPGRTAMDLAGPVGELRAWLARHRPAAVVHLAGRRGGADAAEMFRNNVAATYNLLEAVASTGFAPRIVVASSAAVYGNAAESPLTVTTERQPVNIYGASKALQEDVCTLARAMWKIDISVARIFNVVGAPGDSWSVLPNLIASVEAAQDESVVPVANADCTRDFVHADDVCTALTNAATQSNVPAVFNVATGTGTAISALAVRVAHALKRPIRFRFDASSGTATIRNSIGDPAESLAMGLHYRPITDDDIVALSATLRAERNVRSGEKAIS